MQFKKLRGKFECFIDYTFIVCCLNKKKYIIKNFKSKIKKIKYFFMCMNVLYFIKKCKAIFFCKVC